MTTKASPFADAPTGRVFRTRYGRWALMNKEHFHWLINGWWETGYEAGVKAAAERAGQA